MKSLLLGLKDTHKLGIMHRDIKPANLLLKNEDKFDEIAICGKI